MEIEEYIRQHIDKSFQGHLPFPVIEKKLVKGEIIHDFAAVEEHVYFLKEGIVEISILHQDKESILEFIFPDNFFCAYASFLTQQPSDTRLECLTDCTINVVRRVDVLEAYEHSLVLNKLGRYVTEQLYLKRYGREKQFLTQDAEERYLQLIRQRPQVLANIPLYKIANYLGIHPESLSRIRKKIIS